ncbi:MAG: UxaA family hydrolase [bacterium]
MSSKVLKVHPADNIVVALQSLSAGETILLDGQALVLKTEVAEKHKFAARDLLAGDEVVMYGTVVGIASQDIARGSAIATANVRHIASDFRARRAATRWTPPDVQQWQQATFPGYHRSDGQVGTGNYWLVIPLVFCENRNVEVLREAFGRELGYARPDIYDGLVAEMAELYRQGKSLEAVAKRPLAAPQPGKQRRLFKHVDGIKFLTHEGGCGGTREDAHALCALFAGTLNNPNVAGATVLSLGCQNAQVEILRAEIQKRNATFDKPVLIFEQQQYRSERDMVCQAIKDTFVALANADRLRRAPAPLSKLTVGVECGASDGFSGLSANPAIGHVSDLIVALGGKVILSEFPELSGVEQALINRCRDDATADKFVRLMQRYAARAEAVGSGFDMNPSPGNIKEGLITDAMKSAGAAKKGGTSPVNAVLAYPEYAVQAGLNLLCTPGNDVESTTGLAGAGANLILFSTGLGTPTGNPVTPVIKISSNTPLAQNMPDLIDIDSGGIITGQETIPQVAEMILHTIIRVASGEMLTKAQQLGQDDFIPWKQGISL